jgi:hypothetical protein
MSFRDYVEEIIGKCRIHKVIYDKQPNGNTVRTMKVTMTMNRINLTLFLLTYFLGSNNVIGSKQLSGDSKMIPEISTIPIITNEFANEDYQYRQLHSSKKGKKSSKESITTKSAKMMSSKSMKMKMSSKKNMMKHSKSSVVKMEKSSKRMSLMDKKMSYKQKYDVDSSSHKISSKDKSSMKSMKKKSFKTNNDMTTENTDYSMTIKSNDGAIKLLPSSSSLKVESNNNYPNEITNILLEDTLRIVNATSN